ncbi:hypothetical protein KEM55_004317 [Ascosphaera atra]|nr:hypothetical protein KEM55_004317 [Ascosphaera atra]
MEPVGPDKRRTKSPTLRRILQSLVVRHRPDDISSQIELPPLSNTVVYLEPTFYDKLTLNLFIAALVVNAITSERTGKDYMFSPGNRKFVNELITNLRQAGFWWTGMKESHVSNTVSAAREYLERNRARMSADDVDLLQQAIRIGSLAIGSPLWHALTLGEEMAVFVENFPDRGREEWTLDRLREFPTYHLSVLGISQATAAAKFVASHGATVECFEGLPGEGLRYRILFDNAYQPRNGPTATKSKNNKFALAKDPVKPQQIQKPASTGATDATDEEAQSRAITHPDIAKTRLVATASSKLTYLLDKVREYQDDEKIIVFYEHRQFGFWISEAFRLLQINFRTFGEEDTPKQRAEALLTFTESEDVRVLVMNLKQASHGLHIACASRVFIITPIWDPNVESQAIKRAHRMSQKRPVFVETLVLRGTLEEKMLERRKQMQASSEGMQNAEKHPLDDRTMSDIIKNERFLEIPQTEVTHLAGRPAYLKKNAQLFHKNAVQPNPAPPVVGPPSLSITPSTTPSRSRLRAVQQGQPPAMTPQRLDTIFTMTPGRGRGRGRTPRPRPTFTSPIGISYENSPRSYRTPRNSPGKRRQQSQDAGPALPPQPPAAGSSRKKRRVAFAAMPEDPFLDAPSEQGPSGN